MKKVISGVLVMLTLSACGWITKDKMGLSKQAPDEFMVTTRKPLSLPPEYDLRPIVEDQEIQDNELSSLEDVFVKKLEAGN